jgi:hypothetical protein
MFNQIPMHEFTSYFGYPYWLSLSMFSFMCSNGFQASSAVRCLRLVFLGSFIFISRSDSTLLRSERDWFGVEKLDTIFLPRENEFHIDDFKC